MNHLRSAAMADCRGTAHGFFGRSGGVSTGLYESLNCGLGSGDDPANVAENRGRVARSLGVARDNLLTLYQVHSPTVLTVGESWGRGQGPQADAMVTRTPGLALGILAADCTPILLADEASGVIGACHAGWKGALAGVAQATVNAMEQLGGERARMVAAIGPAIRQPAYEVGSEFRERFLGANPANDIWFVPGKTAGKFQFDLPGFLASCLKEAGVARIDDPGVCTYEGDYFSFRRTTHQAEPDYGRNISAIALT